MAVRRQFGQVQQQCLRHQQQRVPGTLSQCRRRLSTARIPPSNWRIPPRPGYSGTTGALSGPQASRTTVAVESIVRTTPEFRRRGHTTGIPQGRPIPMSQSQISPTPAHFPTIRAGPIRAGKDLAKNRPNQPANPGASTLPANPAAGNRPAANKPANRAADPARGFAKDNGSTGGRNSALGGYEPGGNYAGIQRPRTSQLQGKSKCLWRRRQRRWWR